MRTKRTIRFAVMLIVLATILAPATQAGKGCKNLSGEPGYFEKTIWSGGVEREYILYVHPRYKSNRPTPLVFLLHGLTQTPEHILWWSNMAAFADAFKFILVVPKGIDLNWAVNSNGHDVPFVADMIDAVRADYCIHPKRVFATGFSKGAGMAHRLACELADRIAAIGPVAGGNNWYFHGDVCDPSRPVPIIQFNGTKDVMAGGGDFDPAFFAAWADLYGCSGDAEIIHQKGEVTCFEYLGCPDETTLRHCIHEGGGHNWPGGIDLCEFYNGDPFWCWLVGETTDDIDASREIWKFFAEHAMGGDD